MLINLLRNITLRIKEINRKFKYTLALICFLFLSACASPELTVIGQAKSEWDFDHNLQFKKTKFDDKHYRLEVIANNKTRFERLSAFLLRRSYLICGGHGFKLTLIKGVESFDFKKQSPNLIKSNLTAELECPIKK